MEINEKEALTKIKAELKKVKEENDKLKKNNEELSSSISSIKEIQERLNLLENEKNIVNSAISMSLNKDKEYIDKINQRDIRIVHGVNSIGTTISTYNRKFHLTSIGEKITVSWEQFEEIYNKYRNWFLKNGILYLDEGFEDIAVEYGLPIYSNKNSESMTKKKFEESANMGLEELRDFVLSLSPSSQRAFYILWMQKCEQDSKDTRYFDSSKMELFQRISKDNTIFQWLIYRAHEYEKEQNKK